MKKAQVSFEYMLLFSFALLIFIVVGTIIISGLEKTREFESETEYLVKEIKTATIIASLSDSDFNTTVEIPITIAGKPIMLDVHGSPDNYVKIRGDSGLASIAFLPKIEQGLQILNIESGRLEISKTNEIIRIEHKNG